MNLQDPALTFALAITAGVVAQSLARHARVPGILLLLATGILLGPEFANIVRPDTLGDGLNPIVGLAVAVILFEGALQLNLDRLRREALTIRRLITLGALVTIAGAAVTAMLALGWSLRIALLFGALVSVTGPTVINPLTRRIRLRSNLRTILEAEGVLIDPVGAILAVVAFELALASTAGDVGAGFLGLVTRLGLGSVIGVAGGFIIGGLLRMRRAIPSDLRNIFTLACVLALYQGSHAILPESGIMTVAIAGLVVGNMGPRHARELVEFKEQLTFLLVGLLFVLLSAAVDLADVRALGAGGIVTVIVLVAVIRPLCVLLCTRGAGLSRNEQAFLAWLAPRGIVAFAVSSLFAAELAHSGMEVEGNQLRAMVFLVIAVTVVVLGGTGGLVARLLGVRKPSNHGFAIVGANPIGRALARTLRAARGGDAPIVLIDTNPTEAGAAESDGFRVVLGNANDSRALLKAGVESRHALVALTPNEGVNLLIAKRVEESCPGVSRLVAIDPLTPGVEPEQVDESGASVLFGLGLDHERWAHEFRRDRVEIEPLIFEGLAGRRISQIETLADRRFPALALVHRRGRREQPVSSGTMLKPGDVVWFGWLRGQAELAESRLARAGFRRPDIERPEGGGETAEEDAPDAGGTLPGEGPDSER
ncbi:MAG: cation:proton antiporter [Gemmatimonadota bacterium]|uniref:cation:proton antiporter n=1 Tax=Candidatus Palauibacter scopulicola TaxID=3056741 RepID=UPI00238A46F0|nr:cation:proton antiporter [Candidatus Palauibacter scopulicola]MDE2662223.1 cation:proton antiporter [Candidatus Palauibacter scopulicola]